MTTGTEEAPAEGPIPNRAQRRAAARAAAKDAKKPEERKPPLAKVYLVFSHVDEAGDLRMGWKILSGLTTLRTAVEIMNAVALIEQSGEFKNVTVVNWMSLED
ncbi:hypothetical protein [Methylobacterium sp. AMS5]|uniref:hypothetical protein n=1 Tax=Methylobacterium sp. AMS5 TaxID=925818 RepID=UPI00074F8CCC|nr:hypothetical protein [Methylobacterium sp. AMS5]AMB48374.1 hypothetical protein Y590_25735 [Methylobacterium sp. AMS5]